MKKMNQLILDIDTEEAAVITGAISKYLEHKNFSIKSIKLIGADEFSDVKDKTKKKFSFSTWRIQN
ncbi:MAG: hypothetical protein GY756_23610 [bacterium]|nr:hypothetical protein [bacterium]